MKLLTVTVSALLVVASSFASAQDPVVASRLKVIGERFEKLPLEARTEYVKLKRKATEASRNQKFFTCMIAIEDALNIFPDDMDLIWLHGICRAQIHDVDKAISYYDEVLKINPNHIPSLMNLVEINFFDGRYQKATDYMVYINKLIKSRGDTSLPLLDFKYLISISKLAKDSPGKYDAELKRMYELRSYMEDNPYYYYANALREFDSGNKQEGLIWILKAYLIFNSPPLIETWNKALVDTGFIGAHEIMFNRTEVEAR
ncbi:MAG: tetratricopeptide repeat protein [Akkermansiaceae bacterium]